MYLFKTQSLQRERERDRDIFYSLVHSSNSHNDWSWVGLEPGARSFLRVSQAGVGTQVLGPSSAVFSRLIRDLHWKWSSWDSNQNHPYGMPELQVQLDLLRQSAGSPFSPYIVSVSASLSQITQASCETAWGSLDYIKGHKSVQDNL